ncbi:PH domain-containing protein [Aldersonia sp. NBC_00410]|uniref:PH domain-containing protein n=1 Tax=Aldersonia sp. NBC_00410 TaxID=2975954 RepID=UPI00224F0B37|nr:PH domain-containing protein [Aldersonia sp. NBC_00410]MCX5045036.1 PH domain-containing protein [Aldersonia sp. NBC_00410]
MSGDFAPADSTGDRPPSWSTPTTALVAVLVGGVALSAAALLVDNEPAGRLLIGLAAFGLLVIAALGFRQRPRLAVVGDRPARLAVRRLSGTESYEAGQIERARVVRYPRLGRRVPMLELEVRPAGETALTDGAATDTRLLIYGRWDLGTAPEDVLDELRRYGLARRD